MLKLNLKDVCLTKCELLSIHFITICYLFNYWNNLLALKQKLKSFENIVANFGQFDFHEGHIIFKILAFYISICIQFKPFFKKIWCYQYFFMECHSRSTQERSHLFTKLEVRDLIKSQMNYAH